MRRLLLPSPHKATPHDEDLMALVEGTRAYRHGVRISRSIIIGSHSLKPLEEGGLVKPRIQYLHSG